MNPRRFPIEGVLRARLFLKSLKKIAEAESQFETPEGIPGKQNAGGVPKTMPRLKKHWATG